MTLDLSTLPTWSFVLGAMTSLFSVINPPSSASIFAGAVVGMEPGELDRTAKKAAWTATVAMLVFAVAGQVIFSFFGFTALAMRFVGGVLVLYRALHMLYGEDPRERHSDEERKEAAAKLPADFAIIPFGIPLLAGPGTLSTVMGMIAGVTFLEYLVVIVAILANGWVCYQFLRQAPRVMEKMGALGTKVVNKLMGLILAAVAMQFLINGVKGLVQEIRAMPPAQVTTHG